jgi:hypothetical protein
MARAASVLQQSAKRVEGIGPGPLHGVCSVQDTRFQLVAQRIEHERGLLPE